MKTANLSEDIVPRGLTQSQRNKKSGGKEKYKHEAKEMIQWLRVLIAALPGDLRPSRMNFKDKRLPL